MNRAFKVLIVALSVGWLFCLWGRRHDDDTRDHSNPTRDHPYGPKRPHILFIVMDDLGSNDLGLHGSGILTPTADQLAQEGIFLDNYYVLPYCSPTRAAIMTGRYPLHTGCHDVIASDQSQGLPLDEETLPTVLRKQGYSAHAVGKWHLGHSRWEQTPTFRGFQSFYGYYLGWTDHFSHYHHDIDGYDMHKDSREFCGAACSVLADERGNYSTDVFTREAVGVIERHPPNQPLFLYLAHQAVHAPDEVPDRYYEMYKNQTSWTNQRKIYAGMLTAADESISTVVDAMRAKGLWNETLVIYTTDNGGPTSVCGVQGSTNRARGGKCSVWQGGTTGDAFLSGPALSSWQQSKRTARNTQSKETKGKHVIYPHIFHAVDWLPTLAALTGARLDGKPLDGVSQWDSLIQPDFSYSQQPPRQEVFIGYAAFRQKWFGPAVRWKNWKIIQGGSGGPDSYNKNPSDGTLQPSPGGNLSAVYKLYNLEQDPNETMDLSEQYPVVLQLLQQKLRDYQQTYVPPIQNDPACTPFRGVVNTTLFGPTFIPWCSEVVVYS